MDYETIDISPWCGAGAITSVLRGEPDVEIYCDSQKL